MSTIMRTVAAITAAATAIQLTAVDTQIITTLGNGGHVVLSIYTAEGSETVFGTELSGSTLTIVRSDNAKSFPAQSFVVVTSASTAPLEATQELEYALAFANSASTDGTLEITKTFAPNGMPSMVWKMKPTGVQAGTYGGMQVDQYGRIVAIPTNWPQNALPVFNPAGPGTVGGGGSSAASSVSYTPLTGTAIITATNVQDALRQAEAAVRAILDASSYDVQSVTAGPGITVTGDPTNPSISLATSALAAGTYAGFTFDQYGRAIAYAAPVTDDVAVSATAPLAVSYNSLTKTYSLTAASATSVARGVVKITDPAEVTANAVSDPAAVTTYQSVVNYVDRVSKAINLLDAINTTTAPITSLIGVFDAAANAMRKAKLNEAAMLGRSGAIVTGTSLGVNRNVAAVTNTSPGVFQVTLASPLASTNYTVSAVTRNGTIHVPDMTPGSASTFTISWSLVDGTPSNPTAWSFVVEEF